MRNYKKLVEALNSIKEECTKYGDCINCPFYSSWTKNSCGLQYKTPEQWKIKDIEFVRLLESDET